MRLIDANELAKEFDGFGQDIDVLDVLLIIERQKSIDAIPVVHGEWIWDIDGMDWGIGSWICKNCHARPNTYWQCDSTINPLTFVGSSYCPNCGAKMDAKEGTEE